MLATPAGNILDQGKTELLASIFARAGDEPNFSFGVRVADAHSSISEFLAMIGRPGRGTIC